MSIDLEKMKDGMNKAKKLIVDTQAKVLKKVAIAVHQTVVFATPIDTGRARNNWLPNLNTALSNPRNEATGNGAGILTEGRAVIARASETDKIHFTNNLPYIQRLNEGYSAQAPAAFVEKAVQAARAGVA